MIAGLGLLAQALGWRAVIGLAFGAAITVMPAYLIVKRTEGTATAARTAGAIGQANIARMERENVFVEDALAARLAAGRSIDDRGLSNDGFRRD